MLEHLEKVSKAAAKMAEQTQVLQVTTKDLKKVEADNRLAESNRRKKREERAQLAEAQIEPKLIYYCAGAIIAIEALGILSYYVYQSKKTPKETLVQQSNETMVN